MSTVFADTSGWIALLSRDDRLHARALDRYKELVDEGSVLLTNNYVIDVTATRLRHGLGLTAALGYRQMLLAAVAARRLRITWIDERSEAEAWRILKPHGKIAILDLNRHQFEEAREMYADLWLGFTELEMERYLKGAGFRNVETAVVYKEQEAPYLETLLATGEK